MNIRRYLYCLTVFTASVPPLCATSPLQSLTLEGAAQASSLDLKGRVSRVEEYVQRAAPVGAEIILGENMPHRVWQFDARGQLQEQDYFAQGRPAFRQLYHRGYDEVPEGRLVATAVYDLEGRRVRWESLSYQSGRCAEEWHYGNGGQVNIVVRFQYDAEGKLVERATFDGEGNLGTRSFYTYDRSGRLLGIKGRNMIQITENSLYSYGRRAFPIHLFRESEIGFSEHRYEYDRQGNETLWTSSSEGQQWEARRQTYLYDKKGNWIERREYEQSQEEGALVEKIRAIYSRRITYFR